MTIDFRSESNLYRNAVLNCIEVLKKFPSESGREIRNFYAEDVFMPVAPCFCVVVEGSNDERRSSQNMTQMRYTINISVEIWYYHEDLTEETKRGEITFILWEISELLKKNITLNGFVPKLGVEVTGVRFVPRIKGNRILAGGVISLKVRALYTQTKTL